MCIEQKKHIPPQYTTPLLQLQIYLDNGKPGGCGRVCAGAESASSLVGQVN